MSRLAIGRLLPSFRRLLLLLSAFATLIALSSTPAQAVLTLAAEVNPDPAQPGELLDVQLTVSSSTASGNLDLRVTWPAEIDQFPVVTGAGDCPGNSCDTGEFLVWNLGSLGPGNTITVGFNEHVENNAAEGFFSLQIELLEGGIVTETLSQPIEVQADSPLEVSVDPLSDPVAAGGTLIYELVYGNTGNASTESSELTLPLPDGVQFQSATGGGIQAGGTVTWNLGTLGPGAGGRERVRVQVGAVATGTLLIVDAATLSGQINFQPRTSRAMAVSRVGVSALELALELNPDPVQADQLLDTQISVSNPTSDVTGNLTLRVLWPAEIDQFPVVTSAGDCPGNSCDTGEYLFWDLGVLGPGGNITVSFNEHAESFLVDGTLIPVEIELFEGGRPSRNLSHTARVRSDSPLEVFVDPLTDPVAAGGTLVYELVYGNNGNASADDCELNLPLPAGAQFQSATGGGVHSGGTVSWDLGTLAPGTGGRERVQVQVGALPAGTLLVVDAATLSGQINFQPRTSRGMAVSRVDVSALELALELNPDPVQADQLLDTQISVSNPTSDVSGNLTLRALWPAEIDQFPVVTGGGECPGNSCDTGEYLSWDLGVLGPGVSVTVSFNEHAESFLVDGTLIPLEIELFEGGQPSHNLSHTARVRTDSPLEVFVDPLSDPVTAGGTLTYELVFGNNGNASTENSVLTFPLPAGSQFLSATGGGIHTGGVVQWGLGNLPPGSGGREQVRVQVDNLDAGTLLVVDAATLIGEINFQPRISRAMAVSRVAAETLELSLEIDPNPVQANGLLSARLDVVNPTGSVSGNLFLRVLWPAEIDQFPVVTGGGDCPGNSCDTGEYLSWDLGSLGPGGNTRVNFNENAESFLTQGTLIPVEVELFEGGLPARNTSLTVLVHPFVDLDMDGEADVFDSDDDDDGMPDWWERLHGLDPLDPSDADDDPDLDGVTNLGEFLAGTDPNSADTFSLLDRAGLILPGFEVETQTANGATTFFSATNTSGETVPLRIEYFENSVAGAPLRTDDFSLGPQQTRTFDLRQNLDGLPVEDGLARGLAIVTQGGNTTSPDLEGDYFRVDFSGDFAAGDRLVNPEDLCVAQQIRFVDFGSGSELRILLDRPRGDQGPSFNYTAYGENGQQVASGGFMTNQNLLTLDVTELVPAQNFGSLFLDFTPSGSGWASARYTAFGRFSLELNGACVELSTR